MLNENNNLKNYSKKYILIPKFIGVTILKQKNNNYIISFCRSFDTNKEILKKNSSDLFGFNDVWHLNINWPNKKSLFFGFDTTDTSLKDNWKFIIYYPTDLKDNYYLQKNLIFRIENIVNDFNKKTIKKLKLVGNGFKCRILNTKKVSNNVRDIFELSLNYSHEILVVIPFNLTIKISKDNIFSVEGYNKSQVNQFAFLLKKMRIPKNYGKKAGILDF